MEIPKTVTVVVRSGENLEYVAPGSKSTADTRKWSVVFIGGKKKMVSESMNSPTGCPVWNCKVTIELTNAIDPVGLLVIDAKDRHVGQVNVSLVKIPPASSNPLDTSRLYTSELEPTKKNSSPRGRLSYWIWAESYWPPGTKTEGRTKSFRGSLSNLSRALRPKQSKNGSSIGLQKQAQFANWEGRTSPLGSMVSGAFSESRYSSIESHNQPTNWQPVTSHPVSSGQHGQSYDPFAGCDDGGGDQNSFGSQSMLNGGASRMSRTPVYQSHHNVDQLEQNGDSQAQGGKKPLFRKVRNKLSRSHSNLSKAAKMAGGDMYPDPAGSVLSGTTSRVSTLQLPDITPTGGSLTSGLQDQLVVEEPSRLRGSATALNNTSSMQAGAHGWHHEEERPKKPIEDMSRREVNDYALQLEGKIRKLKIECSTIQAKYNELEIKSKSSEDYLNTVRAELADLRNRLLADNLTKYLEVSSPSRNNLYDRDSGLDGGTFSTNAANQGLPLTGFLHAAKANQSAETSWW